jgi:type II secretory pathway pseudopilin PulG
MGVEDWRGEEEMKAMPGHIKVMAWLCVALAVAAVVATFLVVGSPQTVRERRMDAERSSDLAAIRTQVENYYLTHNKLPESLSEINFSYYDVGESGQPEDPLTKRPYGYERTGDTTYTLTATFQAEPLKNARAEGWDYPFTRHGKGMETFELQVTPKK